MKYNNLARLGALVVISVFSGNAMSQTPVPIFSKVFSPDTIGVDSTTTLRFVINNAAGSPVENLAFTDILPGGVDIATPAGADTDCADALLSAPDGGTTISMTGGRLGAGGSCFVAVNVVGTSAGTHMNTSGALTSSAGSSGTASADLTVDENLPGFSKSFSPDSIPLGGHSTLTFTIDNTTECGECASAITTLNFTDNLPPDLVVANPANAATDCGDPSVPATLTAVPGTSFISLSSPGTGTFPALAAETNCTVSVDVTATATGVFNNVSGELVSGDGASSGFATASLDVPVQFLVKSFIDDPVAPGDEVTLRFIVTNLDRDFPATAIAFDDTIDPMGGLSGLAPGELLPKAACGGTLDFASGTLSFTGGSLPANGSCTFDVALGVPGGAATGTYANTTTAITATIDGEGITANGATDNLVVQTVPVLTKEFTDDPVGAGGTATLEFTVTNSSTTESLSDIEFIDELTTFLPLPVSVTLPADGFCGPDSSIALLSVGGFGEALSLTGGNLAAAASCTFTVPINVPDTMPAGTYTNTTGDISGLLSGEISVTGIGASDDLVVVAAPSLVKEFTDDPVEPGGPVTLQFTLSHDEFAPGDATDITFTDDLAATLSGMTATGLPLGNVCGTGNGTVAGSAGDTFLTFSGGTLTPGEVCTFSVTLSTPVGAAAGSHTNTTSSVMATVAGVEATGNAGSDDLRIAGLVLSKEFTDDPVLPGGTVTLEFTIDNTSPVSDATAISFTDSLADVLPGTPDLTVVTALPAAACGGTLSDTSSFLTLTGGALLAGESCVFEVILQVPGAAADGTYNNVTSNMSATIDGGTVSFDGTTDALTIDSNILFMVKDFIDDPSQPGSTVTLEFTLMNQEAAQGMTDIAFSDDLGAALTGLEALGLPLVDPCGAGSELSGSNVLSLTGGNLPAGGSCTFSTTLQVPAGAASGIYTNTTDSGTATVGGLAVSGNPASADLQVNALALSVSKTFGGPSTATGTPTLSFTIVNDNASDQAEGISFSDDLSAVISGLAATSLPVEPCGAGSVITGTTFLAMTGGNLLPGGSCTIEVPLLVPPTAAAGTFTNTTSEIFQNGLSAGAAATADLTIEPPPTFAKVFAADLIPVNGVSTLTLTIDNSASALAANSLDVTDNLPTGVVIATAANASTTCTGGTLTALPGSPVLSYTGGSVAAGASCTVQADTTGAPAGAFVNTTGDLTSSSGNSGAASDTLTIDPPPVVTAPGPITMEATAEFTSVTLGTATVTDNTDTLTATADDTGPFPVGTTIVTWSATDSVGNTSTDTQSVTVTDSRVPTVTPPADITAEATGPTTALNLGDATVIDDVDVGLVATADDPGPYPVGATTVTWSATDSASNTGTATQLVTVVDTTAPVVTLLGSNPLDLNEGDTYSDPGATATDIVDGDLTASIAVSGTVDTGTPGMYVVTYEVTDAAGNTGTATRTVNVAMDVVRSFTGTLPSGTEGTISFSSADSGCTFSGNPQFNAAPAAPPLDATQEFVDGVVSFVITGCGPGATAEVTVDYGRLLDSGAEYLKLDATVPEWYALASSVSGNTIIFSITDGGTGDDDDIPGTITDPGGAVQAKAAPPAAIPVSGPLALWLLACLLMLTGLLAYRRQEY